MSADRSAAKPWGGDARARGDYEQWVEEQLHPSGPVESAAYSFFKPTRRRAIRDELGRPLPLRLRLRWAVYHLVKP